MALVTLIFLATTGVMVLEEAWDGALFMGVLTVVVALAWGAGL